MTNYRIVLLKRDIKKGGMLHMPLLILLATTVIIYSFIHIFDGIELKKDPLTVSVNVTIPNPERGVITSFILITLEILMIGSVIALLFSQLV